MKNELREILKTRSHYKILESKDEAEFFKFVMDYSNVLSNMDLAVLKLEESHRNEKEQVNILEELWKKYLLRDINQVVFLLRNGFSVDDVEQNTYISRNIIDATAEALAEYE